MRLLLRDLLARPVAPSRGTFAVWTPAPHCFILHGRRHPSQPAAGSDSAVGNGPPAVSAPHRGGSRGAGPCGGFPRRRGRTHSYKCPGHFTSASKVAVCPRVPTSPAWRKLGARRGGGSAVPLPCPGADAGPGRSCSSPRRHSYRHKSSRVCLPSAPLPRVQHTAPAQVCTSPRPEPQVVPHACTARGQGEPPEGSCEDPPRTALTTHGRRERGTSKPVVVSVDGKMDAPARIGGVEGRRQCLGKGAGGGGLPSGEPTPVRSDPPTLRLHPRALSRSALGTSQLLPVHTEVGPGVKSWCRQF